MLYSGGRWSALRRRPDAGGVHLNFMTCAERSFAMHQLHPQVVEAHHFAFVNAKAMPPRLG